MRRGSFRNLHHKRKVCFLLACFEDFLSKRWIHRLYFCSHFITWILHGSLFCGWILKSLVNQIFWQGEGLRCWRMGSSFWPDLQGIWTRSCSKAPPKSRNSGKFDQFQRFSLCCWGPKNTPTTWLQLMSRPLLDMGDTVQVKIHLARGPAFAVEKNIFYWLRAPIYKSKSINFWDFLSW